LTGVARAAFASKTKNKMTKTRFTLDYVCYSTINDVVSIRRIRLKQQTLCHLDFLGHWRFVILSFPRNQQPAFPTTKTLPPAFQRS
jgi:hypothetical protein